MAPSDDFEDLCNTRAPSKTWAEVAVITNTSPRTLLRLRYGLLKNPNRVTLQNIANGFKVPVKRVAAAVRRTRDQQPA